MAALAQAFADGARHRIRGTAGRIAYEHAQRLVLRD
jgi:hypothetical protein